MLNRSNFLVFCLKLMRLLFIELYELNRSTRAWTKFYSFLAIDNPSSEKPYQKVGKVLWTHLVHSITIVYFDPCGLAWLPG